MNFAGFLDGGQIFLRGLMQESGCDLEGVANSLQFDASKQLGMTRDKVIDVGC